VQRFDEPLASIVEGVIVRKQHRRPIVRS